jgi:hypothetical protein
MSISNTTLGQLIDDRFVVKELGQATRIFLVQEDGGHFLCFEREPNGPTKLELVIDTRGESQPLIARLIAMIAGANIRHRAA